MNHQNTSAFAPIISIIIIIGILFIVTVLSRRKGYSGIGGRTIVRCQRGHLFSTIWIPGASLKSIRLGIYRFQFCPVGRHWSLVKPVKDSNLSDQEKEIAEINKDTSVF